MEAEVKKHTQRGSQHRKYQKNGIRIDYAEDNQSKGKKDLKGGEYIDYEEID